jgi:hypothetical protein
VVVFVVEEVVVVVSTCWVRGSGFGGGDDVAFMHEGPYP